MMKEAKTLFVILSIFLGFILLFAYTSQAACHEPTSNADKFPGSSTSTNPIWCR